MGDNAEIYQRLGKLETDVAQIKERLTWTMRFMWLLFPSGGLFGWALTKLFGG
ncbi:MAG: hypothetical protein IKE55_10995 [Kiritimatiellae bacterium]|nr:hypothetical protein [Kiritimatiellia bacterium]